MHKPFLVAALSACFASPAIARQRMAEYQKLHSAMQSAQANAVRPGDEELDCPALESEMIASVSDPALKDRVAQLGARAERDQQTLRGGGSQMTIQTVMTVFASLVPGGAWTQAGVGLAQMPSQRAQAANRVEQIRADGMAMMKLLPAMLRGQRVIELAQSRGCPWLPNEILQDQ